MDFASWLRKFRAARGLSTYDVAKKTNVTPNKKLVDSAQVGPKSKLSTRR